MQYHGIATEEILAGSRLRVQFRLVVGRMQGKIIGNAGAAGSAEITWKNIE
jgi:hypothetical protein